jgi:hypothetical protein
VVKAFWICWTLWLREVATLKDNRPVIELAVPDDCPGSELSSDQFEDLSTGVNPDIEWLVCTEGCGASESLVFPTLV